MIIKIMLSIGLIIGLFSCNSPCPEGSEDVGTGQCVNKSRSTN
jgi:hypothetical protein